LQEKYLLACAPNRFAIWDFSGETFVLDISRKQLQGNDSDHQPYVDAHSLSKDGKNLLLGVSSFGGVNMVISIRLSFPLKH